MSFLGRKNTEEQKRYAPPKLPAYSQPPASFDAGQQTERARRALITLKISAIGLIVAMPACVVGIANPEVRTLMFGLTMTAVLVAAGALFWTFRARRT